MRAYLDIVKKVLSEGTDTSSRTGINTRAITGAMFEHDMSKGFPLLTTKKVSHQNIRSELEFFIKGYTDKQWLQDRNNTIWNEWCNREKVPYGHDDETRKKMAEERDLGPIYGWQWRHSNTDYVGHTGEHDYTGEGFDQLEMIVDRLKNNPTGRRMVVTSWNPKDIGKMALPPCHYSFQVLSREGKLDLIWNQRSVDTMLGLPFNIASYALLLELLAKQSKLEPGKLIGFLGDTHIYHNHLDGAREQILREPMELPRIETVSDGCFSLFEWKYTDTKIKDYKSHPKIKFDIAV
ncbi:MAG: thymidylate synthase [Nanoarchaeota archaeon]|nr:thymidylate synthase [Nanoarchaeota archaeon]